MSLYYFSGEFDATLSNTSTVDIDDSTSVISSGSNESHSENESSFETITAYRQTIHKEKTHLIKQIDFNAAGNFSLNSRTPDKHKVAHKRKKKIPNLKLMLSTEESLPEYPTPTTKLLNIKMMTKVG